MSKSRCQECNKGTLHQTEQSLSKAGWDSNDPETAGSLRGWAVFVCDWCGEACLGIAENE